MIHYDMTSAATCAVHYPNHYLQTRFADGDGKGTGFKTGNGGGLGDGCPARPKDKDCIAIDTHTGWVETVTILAYNQRLAHAAHHNECSAVSNAHG